MPVGLTTPPCRNTTGGCSARSSRSRAWGSGPAAVRPEADGPRPVVVEEVEQAGVVELVDHDGLARRDERVDGDPDGVVGTARDVDLAGVGHQPGGGVAASDGLAEGGQPERFEPVPASPGHQVGGGEAQLGQVGGVGWVGDREVDAVAGVDVVHADPGAEQRAVAGTDDAGAVALPGDDEPVAAQLVERGGDGAPADGERLRQPAFRRQQHARGQESGVDRDAEGMGEPASERAVPVGGPVAEQTGDLDGCRGLGVVVPEVGSGLIGLSRHRCQSSTIGP